MTGYLWSCPVTVAVDVGAWFVIHVTIGWAAHRLDARRFATDTWWSRPRQFEHDGSLYERLFAVRRWKHWLPEAGAVFAGGFDKRQLGGSSVPALARYAAETRRAEFAHWLTALPAPLFVLWNPVPVAAAMVVYAVVVNGPCIVALRYNRCRIVRIAYKRGRQLP